MSLTEELMSLDDKVHTALKSLIDHGLVQEIHTNQHALYVEGGLVPDEVNVSAVLNASEPEQHRLEIEDLLHKAGLGKVVLHLQGNSSTPNQSSEAHTEQEPADKSTKGEKPIQEQHIQERAFQLWEAEGKPEGRINEYWHRARELLEDESQSSYPPTQSRGHRT
jgi:Protein of unknown function (DUF2934)